MRRWTRHYWAVRRQFRLLTLEAIYYLHYYRETR